MARSTVSRVLLALAAVAAAASTKRTSAFVTTTPILRAEVGTATPPTTQLHVLFLGNTVTAPPSPPATDIAYGEESRKYRRTVYSHDDWVKHRSPDRFWRNLRTTFSSGIYKNIGNEVAVATAVAVVVVVWNALVGGYLDFDGVRQQGLLQGGNLPMLGLPLTPFTLSSPSLGLLLGTYHHTTFVPCSADVQNACLYKLI
jgi:Bestrophin, RFP-TM, chloride channel